MKVVWKETSFTHKLFDVKMVFWKNEMEITGHYYNGSQ